MSSKTRDADAASAYMSLLSRIVVWGLLIGVLFLLQSIFLLVFLTFVFAYVQSRGVDRLERVIANRPLRVTLVGMVFLGILVLLGLYLVPRVRDQAEIFVSQFPSYVSTIDRNLIELRDKYPLLSEAIPEPQGEGWLHFGSKESWSAKNSPTAGIFENMFGIGRSGEQDAEAFKGALSAVRNIGAWLVGIISAFLLSLLFSFLIVLDLPKLALSATRLRDTKLRFIYDEVGPTIVSFSRTLGQAMEAQLYIALLNTLFTSIGVYFLGLGSNVAFLSVIVFFCSFIPVAGVFISSAPICLLALQIAGWQTMLFAVILITVIHMIEAYILNPKIYGARLRMNPVIVLIILTIGGKLFHVWGLILGVPLCNYIFGHAIRGKSKD